MDNDDILRAEDIADARVTVLKIRRKVLGLTAATSVLAAVAVGIAVYYLKLHNVAASTFVGAIFLMLGVPTFVHWWRHYRSILEQLDLVAQRVARGELVYGSQVAFR
ncbi:hypothetical protein [Thermomonas haemolytica]|uniref:hypothetical protein n=1 Tax=Thermomonas haemolytica TaxID=141949 RepID=UPI00104AC527|nr:hypothetical protein [Thermomonas haemolytica]